MLECTLNPTETPVHDVNGLSVKSNITAFFHDIGLPYHSYSFMLREISGSFRAFRISSKRCAMSRSS